MGDTASDIVFNHLDKTGADCIFRGFIDIVYLQFAEQVFLMCSDGMDA